MNVTVQKPRERVFKGPHESIVYFLNSVIAPLNAFEHP